MSFGELQMPKIDIELFVPTRDYQTRIYLQYANIVEDSEEGKSAAAKLKEDPRVVALSNKMISTGSGASRFEIKTLAMWFLWCANEFNPKTAEDYLDSFLDSDEVEVTNTLWVLGIEVDDPIELDGGYAIQPAKGMPDSSDKEYFLQHRFGNGLPQTPTPAVAITKSCQIKKTSNEDPAVGLDENADFWNAGRRLHELSLLLNALSGVSCLPFYSTSYPHPETPFGPFGARGGGLSLHDVVGYSSTKLSLDDRAAINSLAKHYDELGESEKSRIQRILSRLSQAKRRMQTEDKILDLCIALEMLLLEDGQKEQLSLSFRLRGSWLLGTSPQTRITIYKQLKELYGYRSHVAHNGVLSKADTARFRASRNLFRDYQTLAESICRKIIEDGRPSWDEIVLNAPHCG
jgi:hypothetical protein